jgi:hypothetical protein
MPEEDFIGRFIRRITSLRQGRSRWAMPMAYMSLVLALAALLTAPILIYSLWKDGAGIIPQAVALTFGCMWIYKHFRNWLVMRAGHEQWQKEQEMSRNEVV